MNSATSSWGEQAPQRNIPYNYSSFDDKDIIKFFLKERGLWLVETLSKHKVTGVSARMLYEILGDLWMVKRNPHIQEDLISHKIRRKLLLDSLYHRLSQMAARRGDNQHARELLALTQKSIETFADWLEHYGQRRKAILIALSRATKWSNIDATPNTRISCTTDATDWRFALPMVLVNPDSEEELPQLISICKDHGLVIIPRGGATGYHGGIVPLHEETVVVNMEKLTMLGAVKKTEIAPHFYMDTIEAGAGVITQQVSNAARSRGLVFAVDPTSQDVSTIGGNIATNAGGKKALLWGTALDNLYSWKMVMADGTWLQITRLEHNGAKIHDQATVRFSIKKYRHPEKILDTKIISIPGSSIRKAGLGKDVTSKHLFGLPGVQKEGCDGIIVSGVFILHQERAYKRTLALEFYHPEMAASVDCIQKITTMADGNHQVYLSALEHLDHYYLNAVRYRPKGKESNMPNMLLLADVISDDEQALKIFCDELIALATPFQVQAHLAVSPVAQRRFWDDRKRTAAIAAHTNAFKLNEDVVIPLPRLAEYSQHITDINSELRVKNKRNTCKEVLALLAQLDLAQLGEKGVAPDQERLQEHRAKQEQACAHANQGLQHYTNMAAQIESGDYSHSQEKQFSLTKHLFKPIAGIFAGDEYRAFRNTLDQLQSAMARKRLFVALHMHAGDGNIHTNIPVCSDDHEMMVDAMAVVRRVMALAVSLDGVISGEHGIGITKIEFLPEADRKSFIEYKKLVDPDDLFNRGKLTQSLSLTECYTPSFHLVQQEAIILEQSELGTLNGMIKNCLRCGKCKPVCATHVPEANLLYSPRNKILATSSIIESFLYEEQTRRGISLSYFESMLDVADHCTVCHKCENPCPVDIDFGEVTMLMRKILRNRKQYPVRLLPLLLQAYLAIRKEGAVNLLYHTVIKGGMFLQRLASRIVRLLPNTRSMLAAPKPTNKPSSGSVIHFMSRPLPGALPAQPMRALLGAQDQRFVPVFKQPSLPVDAPAVFYFPGCGSERLYSTIGLATVAMLYDVGVQTVLPPGYLCCGYPQRASGLDDKSKAMIAENQVLFHRMANSLNYLPIESVVVSCGTCYDQLTHYQLDSIFPSANLIDIHEYLYENEEFRERHAATVAAASGTKYLYHSPCHSPIKKADPLKVTKALLDTESVVETTRCCGESGSFAFERPDIATQVRHSKANSIKKSLAALEPPPDTTTKILTSCPACHQGLSRFTSELAVESDYLVVEYARKVFGESWQKEFINRVKQEQGLEKILL